mmetsp:Transcript_8149/g.17692  ORF Transcript_8149/g.17692 Transcript_8149/m.17692 type:complete len:275 (-) Transcript_8149:776-1600(-)
MLSDVEVVSPVGLIVALVHSVQPAISTRLVATPDARPQDARLSRAHLRHTLGRPTSGVLRRGRGIFLRHRIEPTPLPLQLLFLLLDTLERLLLLYELLVLKLELLGALPLEELMLLGKLSLLRLQLLLPPRPLLQFLLKRDVLVFQLGGFPHGYAPLWARCRRPQFCAGDGEWHRHRHAHRFCAHTHSLLHTATTHRRGRRPGTDLTVRRLRRLRRPSLWRVAWRWRRATRRHRACLRLRLRQRRRRCRRGTRSSLVESHAHAQPRRAHGIFGR